MEETGRRPTEEIEITPEMIEAGNAVLSRFDPEFGSFQAAAEAIIRDALFAGGYLSHPAKDWRL